MLLFVVYLFNQISSAIVLRPFPSAEYLGLGYNLVAGNPEPNHVASQEFPVDVGWRLPILKLDVGSNVTSNDSKYSIPGDTLCDYIGTECSLDTITTTLDGETSYAAYLFKDMNWYKNSNDESDLNNASFAVSYTYKKFEDIWSNENLMISANAKCPTYHYYYNPSILFQLRSEFKNYVKLTLSVAVVMEQYYAFLDLYGTHVTVGLDCGSRYARMHAFNQTGWNQMGWDKYNIPYLANAEYQLSINPNAPYNQTIKNEVGSFINFAVDTFESVIGFIPFTNWLTNSTFHPFPYYYTLMPIIDLLTPTYFPLFDQKTLAKIRNNTIKAISTYCDHRYINGSLCKPHSPNFGIPQSISPNSSPINSSGADVVDCSDSNQVALSCGLATNITTNNPDKFWSVYPKDDSVCTGQDSFGSDLYSICVYTSQTTTAIYSKSFTDSGGETTVLCPNNWNITGCGLKVNNPGNKQFDSSKALYAADSQTCFCRHKYGGVCYATCSHVPVIVKTHYTSGIGGHWTNSTCTSGLRLFGCGIDLQGNSTQISLPSFYGINSTTCTGYSNQDYVLHVICGGKFDSN